MTLECALRTRALYQQIHLPRLVSLRQFGGWNINVVEAMGLTANGAFEMNMIMVMICHLTVFVAQCIFESASVIEHFVDHPAVKKCPERAVNGNPVKRRRNFLFNIRVRKCMGTRFK